MITDYHTRCRWILIHVPYDYLLSSIILLIMMIKEIINRNGWPNTPPIHHHIFAMWVMIWMKERSNIYAFAMSQRWHQYGGPSWICQNHAYVFAHCRYLDLLVCPLCICQTQLPAFADKWYQRFFWSRAGFLPKLFQYFSSQPSAFSDRWYPYLLFSSLLIIGIHSSSPFSLQPIYTTALPTEWWIDRVLSVPKSPVYRRARPSIRAF